MSPRIALEDDRYGSIPMYRMSQNPDGHLGFYTCKVRSRRSTLLHRHEYLQINYILSGQGEHTINDAVFPLVRGDIFVVPPGVPHKVNPTTKELVYYEFEFNPSFINANFTNFDNAHVFFDFAYIEPFLVAENQVRPRLNLQGEDRTLVEMILQDINNEYKERKPGFELLIKAKLLNLLVIVGRAYNRDLEQDSEPGVISRNHAAIFDSIRYIKENYAEELHSDDVARRFALSPSYFRYLFKSVTSTNFTGFLQEVRINVAMDKLTNTDHPIIDIAYEVGFNNYTHFSRTFRSITGVAPRDYRRNSRSERERQLYVSELSESS
ncbi:MAG: AraC family transcriptional regulator [Clostridiaceae bacterium]|nr:AraC family transcriptional regulator [Clostridiaceae bacterium]